MYVKSKVFMFASVWMGRALWLRGGDSCRCLLFLLLQGLTAQPWWSGIHYVEQTVLKLTEICLPLPPRG